MIGSTWYVSLYQHINLTIYNLKQLGEGEMCDELPNQYYTRQYSIIQPAFIKNIITIGIALSCFVGLPL